MAQLLALKTRAKAVKAACLKIDDVDPFHLFFPGVNL
jgi:hypothetical protein